ncbi:MAG: hypothetical protein WCJ26_03105 [bacterium]
MKEIHRHIILAGIICVAAVTLFLTFNRHAKSGCFNFQSEIWGDKAGYYVYLPAAINFRFNPANFPDSTDHKTGYGFRLDYINKKVLTKYTCGVAILQLPFYLTAELLSRIFHAGPEGFSVFHHRSIDVAAVFYLLLGMFFLAKYLGKKFTPGTVFFTLAGLFLATNLYYYSIDETGMSHIYSFAIFSLFLYTLQRTDFLFSPKTRDTMLLGILGGLIILIRPSNIVFLSVFFFLDTETTGDILLRIKRLLRPGIFLPVFLGVMFIMLPQMSYWVYAYGSPVSYTYGGEGFHWSHPKFLQTWFAPHNGLFLYSPFYLVLIAAMFLMIKKGIKNGMLILALFMAISYLFSSWWDPAFGCSFGARSYVEYTAIFSIPLAHLFESMRHAGRMKMIGFWLMVISLVILNLKMTYSYGGCFFGNTTWDWDAYLKIVTSPTK